MGKPGQEAVLQDQRIWAGRSGSWHLFASVAQQGIPWSPQGSPLPLTHLCCPLSIVILPPVLSPGLILSQLLVNCGGLRKVMEERGRDLRQGRPCPSPSSQEEDGEAGAPTPARPCQCGPLPEPADRCGSHAGRRPATAAHTGSYCNTATSRSVLLGCHPTAWLLMPHTFPGAAVTNHHKSHDFKRHRFIPLQFWRSEPKMILWTKSGCWQG